MPRVLESIPTWLGEGLRLARDGVELAYLRRYQPHLAQALVTTAPYSLTSQRKRRKIYLAAHRSLELGIAGAFVEIGTHRGGTAGVLAAVAKLGNRPLHLFDRWGDVLSPTKEDGDFGVKLSKANREWIPKELQSTDLKSGVELLLTRDCSFDAAKLKLYQGWYNETLLAYSDGPIAFAHIDADLYESTRLALAFIDQHMTPGGIVVLDDWDDWPGVKKAFDEYQATTKRSLHLEPGRGQAILTLDRTDHLRP